MQDSVALQRYLQRHIESGLPPCPPGPSRWHHVLVIPAYREPATLLQCLAQIPAGTGRTLVILVLNRPDTDPETQANAPLREALRGRFKASAPGSESRIGRLNDHCDLYVHDLESSAGPVPAAQGVGLARKIGCDTALRWMHEGAISGDWICSTDADAALPPDYFARLGRCNTTTAAVFPFQHIPGPDLACNQATALYELRLHHYVLGLEYAASPYAHHSLGSCLAVRPEAYAQVRGFPRRAGGEDFYLLNKLSKLGPVARLGGQGIQLQSRYSRRVPFGTGPAVDKIAGAAQPAQLPLFYHPACFAALRAVLAAVPVYWQAANTDLQDLLLERTMEPELARACSTALDRMGMQDALAHCRRQGKSSEQFLRQFHQWFDAFRSLKFIHALRDTGWPQQSLAGLGALQPGLWPGDNTDGMSVGELLSAVNRHWGWQYW